MQVVSRNRDNMDKIGISANVYTFKDNKPCNFAYKYVNSNVDLNIQQILNFVNNSKL